MRSITRHDGRMERRTAQFDVTDFPEIERVLANFEWIRKRLAREL